MTFRRPPSLDTFIPKINGGVPTSALGNALQREALKRAAEILQATPVKQNGPKPPTEGK